MQLEKKSQSKPEIIDMYEDLFSKKNSDNEVLEEEQIKKTLETQSNPSIKEETPALEIKDISSELKNESFFNKIRNKINSKSKNIKLKYIVEVLLVGIIVNISYYHYQETQLQNNSQELATGLIYNLSESNDLQQIATNIYLGMKDTGWEPTVKISNSNLFVFSLDKGAEFTITKNVDLVNTTFHVNVENFSHAMIKALMIQLEPNKIGGTRNLIINKRYDSRNNSISFDVEKIGAGTIYNMPIPSTSYLPPLPNSTIGLPRNNIDSQIIRLPISPELDKKIMNKGINSNIDLGIQIKNPKKDNVDNINDLKSNIGKK